MLRRVLALTDAQVEFGRIPEEHWVQPATIDEEKAKKSRDDMVAHNIIYGGEKIVLYSLSCRNWPWKGSVSYVPKAFQNKRHPHSNIDNSRYRNMCRFNSGVRTRMNNLVNGVKCFDFFLSVLLSAWAVEAVQVLLEGRVSHSTAILESNRFDQEHWLGQMSNFSVT